MWFNTDLLDVVSEAHIGFTIPTALVKSSLYKYFSNRSLGYKDTTRIIDFVNSAIEDKAFIKYIYSSKETAEWFKEILNFELNYRGRTLDSVLDSVDDYEAAGDILLRIEILLDNRGEIKDWLDHGFDYDALYAFATIDQIRWVIGNNPKCLSLDTEVIMTKIGRLDVMQLLYETNRDIFKKPELGCYMSELNYNNKYDHRTLETLEWLMKTLDLNFDELEIAEYADIFDKPNEKDDSIVQWIMIQCTETVIEIWEEYSSDSIISILFQFFNKQTIQLYFEKIETRLPLSFIDDTKMENMKYLCSLITESEKAIS